VPPDLDRIAMPDLSSFAPSERPAVKLLSGLRTPYGEVNEYCFNNRNERKVVTEIDLREVIGVDDDVIRAIGKFESLQNVSVDEDLACDLLLEVLSRLPNLERLVVWNGGRITDAGVAHLARAARLANLDLRNPGISDAALESIGKIQTLENLSLDGDAESTDLITNKGMAHLARLGRLSMLSVMGRRIDDAGGVEFSKLKNLSYLSLEFTSILGPGLAPLCSLKKLRRFTANDSLLEDTGLKVLSGCARLENLMLRRTKITDAGVRHLAKFPSLTKADFAECSLTDKSAPAFARCEKLKSLCLEGTAVTPAGRAVIKASRPRCKVLISEPAPKQVDPPWTDARYFWKHPAECLARFKLTKERVDDLAEWSTRFALACSCGNRKGEVRGYPLATVKRGRKAAADEPALFVGPLSFHCGQCEKATEIIDTDDDGYHGRLGASAVVRGKGKADVFACPSCSSHLWQVEATVQMNEGAFDLWYDDQEIAIENYFDGFELEGTCSKCRKVTTIAHFENLG